MLHTKHYMCKYKHSNQRFHMTHFWMKGDDIKHVMIALLEHFSRWTKLYIKSNINFLLISSFSIRCHFVSAPFSFHVTSLELDHPVSCSLRPGASHHDVITQIMILLRWGVLVSIYISKTAVGRYCFTNYGVFHVDQVTCANHDVVDHWCSRHLPGVIRCSYCFVKRNDAHRKVIHPGTCNIFVTTQFIRVIIQIMNHKGILCVYNIWLVIVCCHPQSPYPVLPFPGLATGREPVRGLTRFITDTYCNGHHVMTKPIVYTSELDVLYEHDADWFYLFINIYIYRVNTIQ